MRFSLGFGVLISVVLAALATHFFSIEKFGDHGGFRQPASIPPNALNLYESDILDSAAKKRILAGTRAWKENGTMGVTVGHYIAKNVGGGTSQLCDLYQNISLTFTAEGMAVSGSRPTMTIEGACVMATNSQSNGQMTAPLFIPLDQIQQEKPADLELRYTTPSDIVVRLKDIPGEWPSYWVLTEIKMLNKKEGRSIAIDTATIYKLSAVPISISWN